MSCVDRKINGLKRDEDTPDKNYAINFNEQINTYYMFNF